MSSIVKLGVSVITVVLLLSGCGATTNKYNDLASQYNIKILEKNDESKNDDKSYSVGKIIKKNEVFKSNEFKSEFRGIMTAIIENYVRNYSRSWRGNYVIENNIYKRYPKYNPLLKMNINSFQKYNNSFAVSVRYWAQSTDKSIGNIYLYMSFEPIFEKKFNTITLKGVKPHLGFHCNNAGKSRNFMCNTNKGQELDEWFDIYNKIQNDIKIMKFN